MDASPLCNPAHAGETTSSSSETSLNSSQQFVLSQQGSQDERGSERVPTLLTCLDLQSVIFLEI